MSTSSTLYLFGMMDYDLVCYDRDWQKSILAQQSVIVPPKSGFPALSSFQLPIMAATFPKHSKIYHKMFSNNDYNGSHSLETQCTPVC